MKILITDDHKIVREGLREILNKIPEITSIDEAQNGKETLAMANEKDFDLILLDISLPDTSGIEILKLLKKKHPSLNILMLSMHSQEQYAIRALNSGASGYLTKDTASEELIIATKKILAGGKYISASLAENIANHLVNSTSKPLHEKLSEREFEIMIRIAKGKSLQDIGDELFISAKTVSTYRARVMNKMGMKKNAEITQYCIRNGLIE